MVFSTISIHVSSVEFCFALDDDASFRQKLRVAVKTAPIFIPFIIFRAGALAVIFAGLKYGGLIHLGAWIILGFIGEHIHALDEDNIGWMDKILGACISMAINNYPDYEFNLKGTRTYVWLIFCINTFTLIVSYLLSRFATDVTFYNETNCWLRENLHIVVTALIALGLASCTLFELYAKFKLHWLSGKESDHKMLTRSDCQNETELTELNSS